MVVNCGDVWQQISSYLDGEMDGATKEAFERHFGGCRKCRAIVEGTRNIVKVFGDEQLVRLPSGFQARVERRLTAEVEGKRRAKSVWMATAVASGLLAASALITFQGEPRSEARRAPMSQPTRRVPQKLVAVSNDGKTFHVAGCPFLHGKWHLMPAEEAVKKGYSPCTRCMKEALESARNQNRVEDGEETAVNFEQAE